MMEFESFSCLRTSEPVPLKSSSLSSPKLTESEIKMVVETHSHSIRPMTPDPLPEPSEQQYQLMPPENAVTPSPDNPPSMDYANVHGSIISTDTDHPSLSPSPSSKAADTDGEAHSSPSQSSERQRSRRKPTLEDIVRRMKGPESNYFTDESEDENMNEPLTIDMEQSHDHDHDDEVDGGYTNGFYKNNSVHEEMKVKLFGAQNGDGDEISDDLKATLLGMSNGMDFSNKAKPILEEHVDSQINDCIRVVLGGASNPETFIDNITPALIEAKSQGEINEALKTALLHLQNGGEISESLKAVLLDSQNGDLHENLKMTLLGVQNGRRIENGDSPKSNQTGLPPREDSTQSPVCEQKSKDMSVKDDLHLTPKSNIQSNISIDGNISTPGDNFKQPGNYLTPKMNGMSNAWYSGPFNGLPPFPYLPSPLDHRIPPNFLPLFDSSFPSSAEVEKDYLKCQYCERTFRRQKNLENHIDNTHHGKGPVRRKTENGTTDMYFKCTHCPYTTKHQSNLYVHIRIHTGERPYICGACGVQYSQSHSLKSHIINKHDGIMSYYIKEKRTRSPRGLGYLTTQILPEMSMFNKLNHSPSMVSPSLVQQQANRTPKINGIHQLGGQFPSISLPQSDYLGKSLDLSKILSEQMPVMQASPQQQQHMLPRSSPHGYINGHGSFSYGSMTPHVNQVSPNDQAAAVPTPYRRNHTPLQEISNSYHDNCGAMDLTKKAAKESEIHRSFEKGAKCPEGSECINCLHSLKLRRLRTNVVRMLSILVPNLNFEEKGISSEGDSVDDLLHDVIESNIQDEEMSE